MRRRRAWAIAIVGAATVAAVVGALGVGAQEAERRTVSLVAGWNTVAYTGLEMAPSDLQAELGSLEAVLRWEAATQSYVSYRVGLPASLNTLRVIEPGDALWIKVGAAGEWEMAVEELPRSFGLGAGWNFVPWVGEEGMGAAEALAGLGDRLEGGFVYDAAAGAFRSYRAGLPAELNDLEALGLYDAVWVRLTTGGSVEWMQAPAEPELSPPTEPEPPPPTEPEPEPEPPISPITGRYLLAFHACDPAIANCFDPRNHTVYLAQSEDGAAWSPAPGWTPYAGSVPDVIRRGETLYVYTPGQVRRYHFDRDEWEAPVAVTLDDPEATAGFVDPSLYIDEEGRLALFYLPGVLGQDPAGCAPGAYLCTKRIRSATEVAGSDGAAFVADAGDRITLLVSPPSTFSDPDIFFDGSRYLLYVSRGPSEQVFSSASLRGTYTTVAGLGGGFLTTNIGGIGSGYYDAAGGQYWTYVHSGSPGSTIQRAVHATLDRALSAGDFTTVLTGSDIGLGSGAQVQSPGFALNTP